MNSLLTFHEEKVKKSLTIVIVLVPSFPEHSKSPCPAPMGEDKGCRNAVRFMALSTEPGSLSVWTLAVGKPAFRSVPLQDAQQLMALQQLQQFPTQL